MLLGRSQLNVAPILGVLCVLFVGFAWQLRYVEIQIPRMLDEDCECPIADPDRPVPLITLHADGSIELTRGGEARHVEAPQVAATLWDLRRNDAPTGSDLPNPVQLRVAEGVRWGDFVESVSSIRHIAGADVAVVPDEQ